MPLEQFTGLETLEGEELLGYVKACFDYNPKTGELSWKSERPDDHFYGEKGKKRWYTQCAGKIIKREDRDGYCRININKKYYLSHRIVFLICKGRWPTKNIDHINGDPTDNRICNLREVSQVLNARNVGITKRNSSGVVGVCWSERTNKWRAYGVLNGNNSSLGSHENFEDAVKARKEWEESEGNFTERHGK